MAHVSTDELTLWLRDRAKIESVVRGHPLEDSLAAMAADQLDAWRELAEALDAYSARQKTGRMPGKVIDRVTAARQRIRELTVG